MVDAVVSINRINHKCSAKVGAREQVPSDLTNNNSSNVETKTDVAYSLTGAAKVQTRGDSACCRTVGVNVCRPYNHFGPFSDLNYICASPSFSQELLKRAARFERDKHHSVCSALYAELQAWNSCSDAKAR